LKRDLKTRLGELRRTGEVKTGRELANSFLNQTKDRLFPNESREEETPFGCCYIRELIFPLDHRHGGKELGSLLNCSGSRLTLPARDERLTAFTPAQSLFFDVETTGLSGGTGTLAFLIGLGWLENNHFLLRQYFLRRPAEERSVLSHFSSAAENFSALITFNGKLFDLPLIQTRQMLAGIRQTTPPLHLDLLQCSRVLWKNRLASRSLRSIEENLLGIRRYDDIPGAEIPAVYFNYLRRGETGRLKQVFQHNVLDILSMVTLLDKISCLGAGENIEHPAEALALGQLCLEAGRIGSGVDFLNMAASGKGPLASEAALELALFYKRKQCWPEAVAIWENLTLNHNSALPARVELAKYYEHQAKNFEKALEITDKALLDFRRYYNFPVSGAINTDALEHRRKRLIRRIASKKQSPLSNS